MTPFLAGTTFASEDVPNGKPQRFEFKDGGKELGTFMLNGKPFQIRGAEIHPQRIPKEYWRHRVQQAKAMGLNTIAFYVFWNAIEKEEGKFDWSGENDIAGFLKICQEEKMWVLYRPGPYTCGEWDAGGIPNYLYKKPDTGLRTLKDPDFMKAQTRWLKAAAKVAKPYLVQNGGPIIMTQLENEYGSFYRRETEYMRWLKDFWTKEGFGPFYTSDGASDGHMRGVVLPGVAVGMDPAQNDAAFAAAQRNNPGMPAFSSETYPGWLRHWGEGNWNPTNLSSSIEWYMKNNKSFSIFVFHGGTNFGFTAGANSEGTGGYSADLTSYDYGSPIAENGKIMPEYHQYRAIIAKYVKNIPEPPKDMPAMETKAIKPKFVAPLDTYMQAVKAKGQPTYFEAWGQNQGVATYKTKLPAGPAGTLVFEHFNDWGHIMLDGKILSTVYRKDVKNVSVEIPERKAPAELTIFVEGMGHINFGNQMEKDRKGIYGKVTFAGKELKNWTVSACPMLYSDFAETQAAKGKWILPGGHYRATLTLTKVQDTFLDMSRWHKGVVYVNGKNLGRYWELGAQQRLYCPAPFLKKGKNVIDVIEFCPMEKPEEIKGFPFRNTDSGKQTENKNNVW
ncbi:MAG: beta-galactosidase [Opitutales bacterium]|nr:beta-galactosidase [Opitutales bacterium]